jgi:hypothetical protein
MVATSTYLHITYYVLVKNLGDGSLHVFNVFSVLYLFRNNRTVVKISTQFWDKREINGFDFKNLEFI